MPDLFVEIFPLTLDQLPRLTAYQLILDGEIPATQRQQMGTRLVQQVRGAFEGLWLWMDDRLLTDSERTPVEMTITADILRGEQAEVFSSLQNIEPDHLWQPAPMTQARLMLRTQLRDLNPTMQAAAQKLSTRIRNASIEREFRLRPWIVEENTSQPAIAISIASRLIYDQNIQQYISTERHQQTIQEKLVGLAVLDKVTGDRGEVVRVIGPMADHRERLLSLAQSDELKQTLTAALDGEWVIAAQFGRHQFEFLASTLQLVVRQAHISRFNLDAQRALQALQMVPAERANQVKAISDVVKEAGAIENAYNSRVQPDLFFSADFEMNLRFAQDRVRAYHPEALPQDFTKCGVYRLQKETVHICVINTLGDEVNDFIEAMQRQLNRHFGFSVKILRERQVRVVSRSNIESAVRVSEKENPDVILAFFPEGAASFADEDADTDTTADYVKSLTLGRGLPTHVIYQSTLNDPDAMPIIIMNILGKTGNTPFVLAEPLEHVDRLIGLDMIRSHQKSSDNIQYTGIVRTYKANGEFLGYRVRSVSMSENVLPYALMRDLLPQKEFKHQQVIIHHDGKIEDDLLTALAGWEQAIQSTFYPIEIVRHGAPRIYATEGGIVQPPWGSAFKLNNTEALLVSSVPKENITPQPLHIRAIGTNPLPINKALRSILVWTLLAYSMDRLPKLPVSVLNADQLRSWIDKGGSFTLSDGTVPFWL